MCPVLECGHSQCLSIGENRHSISQQVSILNSFVEKVGFLCPLPFLLLGLGFSGFSVFRSYACCHSLSSYLSALLYLENAVSLESSTSSDSYNLSVSSSWIPKPILVPLTTLSQKCFVCISLLLPVLKQDWKAE